MARAIANVYFRIVIDKARFLWTQSLAIFHNLRQCGRLPCPFDDIESLGFDFVKFVNRANTHNTMIAKSIASHQLVALEQIPKMLPSNGRKVCDGSKRLISCKMPRPPMSGLNHFCGIVPKSYLSTDDFWIFVSGALKNGDVVSYVWEQNLAPGYQRERVMQRLVTEVLIKMNRCHQRGLHHCHFNWRFVCLDIELHPLWINSGNRYCCRKVVGRDDVHSASCVDRVITRVVNSRYSPLCATPECLLLADSSCEQLDAIESWVFGASLLEVLLDKCITGNDFVEGQSLLPYSKQYNRKAVIRANVAVLVEVLASSDLSVECQLFLTNLLKFQPRDRMKLAEALDHPWIVFGCGSGGFAAMDLRFVLAPKSTKKKAYNPCRQRRCESALSKQPKNKELLKKAEHPEKSKTDSDLHKLKSRVTRFSSRAITATPASHPPKKTKKHVKWQK